MYSILCVKYFCNYATTASNNNNNNNEEEEKVEEQKRGEKREKLKLKENQFDFGFNMPSQNL